jgi:DNA polymerase-3 subunit delta
VSAYRDESGLLEDFLDAGMPAGSVLLFTAASVDRRKRLFKRIADTGAIVEFTVVRERSGALAAESVDAIVDRKLAEHRKRIDAGARRLQVRRAGADPAQLEAEVEKLCLYVAGGVPIAEDDVRASTRDLAESWIFDFTRALAQRESVAAISLLRGLCAQGDHPLRLLALIARELRMLLLARDCLADGLAPWNPRTTFTVFRDQMLPKMSPAQKDAFAGTHPFVMYQAIQNASRTSTAALQRAVLRLQELDVKLKSSGGDPELLLEAFVLDACRAR